MTILDTILATKREEVLALAEPAVKARVMHEATVAMDSGPVRSLQAALSGKSPVALLAEIKKASPSKGLIAPDFQPVEMARAYERAGASAISVLTDREYFQGSTDVLRAVRSAVQLPILRKDFIIDPLQIYEARGIGADAILLIAAALTDEMLHDLAGTAASIGLEVLFEVHSVEEWERIAPLSPSLIGVNNRDLRTFHVDLGVTAAVAKAIAGHAVLVSESGIATSADVRTVAEAGASAILVGETLMRYGLDAVEEGIRDLLLMTEGVQ